MKEGQNGKDWHSYGNNGVSFYEKGQNSKSNISNKKGSGMGVFLSSKGNMGSSSVKNFHQVTNSKADIRNKAQNNSVYVPKSGMDLKVSSNFDKIHQNEKGADPVIPFSNNQFDALNDLEDDDQFSYLKEGVGVVDLSYLDDVEQMEVTEGILEYDAKVDANSQ